MSNSADLRTALIQSILNASLSYPIKWANAPFDTPTNETWLRVTPLYGQPQPYSMTTTDRIDGVLQIDVFVPKGKGDLIGHQVADEIRQALPVNAEKITQGAVSVQFLSVGVSGEDVEDAWYKTIISAQFYTFVDRTQ